MVGSPTDVARITVVPTEAGVVNVVIAPFVTERLPPPLIIDQVTEESNVPEPITCAVSANCLFGAPVYTVFS